MDALEKIVLASRATCEPVFSIIMIISHRGAGLAYHFLSHSNGCQWGNSPIMWPTRKGYRISMDIYSLTVEASGSLEFSQPQSPTLIPQSLPGTNPLIFLFQRISGSSSNPHTPEIVSEGAPHLEFSPKILLSLSFSQSFPMILACHDLPSGELT